MNDINKWNRYYSDPEVPPPWESSQPYHGLVSFLEDCHIRIALGQKGMVGGGVGGAFTSSVLGTASVRTRIKSRDEQQRGDDNAKRAIQRGAYVCELGAGCSASAVFLSELEFNTTAVDISPLARERFFTIFANEAAAHRVNYIVGDVLDLSGLQARLLDALFGLDDRGIVRVQAETDAGALSIGKLQLNSISFNPFVNSSISLLSPNPDSAIYDEVQFAHLSDHRRDMCSPAASISGAFNDPDISYAYEPSASAFSDDTGRGSYRSDSSASTRASTRSSISDYSAQVQKRSGKSSSALQSWPILGNRLTDSGSVVTVNTADSFDTRGYTDVTERLRSSSRLLADKALQWRTDCGEPGWKYCTTAEFDAARGLGPGGKDSNSHLVMAGSSVSSSQGSLLHMIPASLKCIEHGDVKASRVESIIPRELRPARSTSTYAQASAPGIFSFIFDMQCFHVLRDLDEAKAVDAIVKLLKPGGYAMIVVGANPRHSECSLDEVREMHRRKAERYARAQARASAREAEKALDEKLEWERAHGKPKDKYSNIRVERKLLKQLDKESEKQRLAEELGTQDRLVFINDNERYFELSKEGYKAKDEQYRREQIEFETQIHSERIQAAIEAENDALSEQALGTVQSSTAFEYDSSMSFFDGSSLESGTVIDLESASVGDRSFDRSISTLWQPTGGQYEHQRNSSVTLDAPTVLQGVHFLDSSLLSTASAVLSPAAPLPLPEDVSASTDQSSFPSLPSSSSLLPTDRTHPKNSLFSRSVHSRSTAESVSGYTSPKFLSSPYFLRGSEPPRPFSPPTFIVPDTAGINWSREKSSYDEMMAKANSKGSSPPKAKSGASGVKGTDRKLPSIVDPLRSVSVQSASISSSSPIRQPLSAPAVKVSGPPRLYKSELVTPFTEHEEFPLRLEYCRLTTFNATPAYLKMAGIPSSDVDSDEEIWAEMEGVSHVSAQIDSHIKTAPLCWEAVFRKETQEEILLDIA